LNQIKKDENRLEELQQEFKEITEKKKKSLEDFSKSKLITLIKDLKRENKNLKEQLKKSSYISEDINSVLDLLKTSVVKEKLYKEVYEELSYAKKWIERILIIIANEKRATADTIANYITEISETTIKSILGRLSTKNFLEKEFEGRTVYYSLNEKYLKQLMKTARKKEQLSKLFGGSF
jgi:DNA-binding transcriptional ArsR family regulator